MYLVAAEEDLLLHRSELQHVLDAAQSEVKGTVSHILQNMTKSFSAVMDKESRIFLNSDRKWCYGPRGRAMFLEFSGFISGQNWLLINSVKHVVKFCKIDIQSH